MKGKLVILAVGHSLDLIGYSRNGGASEAFLDNLRDDDWHLHSSIFIEQCGLFDCRASQSKINKLFCYKVTQALEEGANIVLVVPEVDVVDKRLRSQAIVVGLPASREKEE